MHVSWYEKIKKMSRPTHLLHSLGVYTYNVSEAWAVYHAFRSHISRYMTNTSGVIPVPTSGHELKTSMCCGKQKTLATQDTYIKMWLRSNKPVSREISGTLMDCIQETFLNFRVYRFKPGYTIGHCFTMTAENIIYICVPWYYVIKSRTDVIIITHACLRL